MDIKFDDAAARALIRATQDTASVCAGVQHNRSISLKAVFDTCAGSYFDLFKNATKCELDDRQKIIGVLYKLEAQINNAIRYANFERERRELQQLLEAECKKSTDTDTEADRCMRKMSISSGPQPRISVDFIATPRPRTIKLSEHHDMVSADTEVLHGFVDDSAKIEAALKASFERLYQAWHTFLISCAWVRIESNSLIPTGLTAYCDENEADRHWIETIAHAFEKAGSGSLSSIVLSVELSKGNADEISRVLSDKSLTKDELKNAVERYMKDPLSRKVVVKYYEGMMRSLDLSDDDAKISRALVVSEAIASDPQTSGEVLQAFGGKDFAFTLMAWEDRVGLPTNVKKVREALKSIFIAGEPYLAQVDPQISKKFAEEIWCPECLENGVDLDKDPSSLVHFKDLAFLLDNAKLSTAFLSRMGELIDLNFRVLAGDFSDARHLLQPVTQAFMSALALNSEASLDFFTKGEYFDSSQKLSPEMREKQEFWIQKQSANIEVFASISAALKSATTSAGQLGTKRAALLVSGINHYLSEYLSSGDGNHKLGGLKAEENIIEIYSNYMTMINYAVGTDASSTEIDTTVPQGLDKIMYQYKYLPQISDRELMNVFQGLMSDQSSRRLLLTKYDEYIDSYFGKIKQVKGTGKEAIELLNELVTIDSKFSRKIESRLSALTIKDARVADELVDTNLKIVGKISSFAASSINPYVALVEGIGHIFVDKSLKDNYKDNVEEALRDIDKNYMKISDAHRMLIIKKLYKHGYITNDMIRNAVVSSSDGDVDKATSIRAILGETVLLESKVPHVSVNDMDKILNPLLEKYNLDQNSYHDVYDSAHTDQN